MLKNYSKALDSLQKVLRVLIIVLFSIIACSMFANILSRTITGRSFPWAEEFAKFSSVWMTMLTLGLASRWNQHFKADFIYDFIPKRAGWILRIIAFLVQFVFIVILFWQGLGYIDSAMGGRSPALLIPMSFIYVSIPVGALIMFLYTAEYFFVKVLPQNGDKEEKQWET